MVGTAPKAQAKTTWWHDIGDHCIDVLVLCQSTGGHTHLVSSRFCLSFGIQSDSMFQNALPVHRANQVSKQLIFLMKFSTVPLERLGGSLGGF